MLCTYAGKAVGLRSDPQLSVALGATRRAGAMPPGSSGDAPGAIVAAPLPVAPPLRRFERLAVKVPQTYINIVSDALACGDQQQYLLNAITNECVTLSRDRVPCGCAFRQHTVVVLCATRSCL